MRKPSKPAPYPLLALDLQISNGGQDFIAGLDEAGRGAWAGPVVAAAVILPLQQPGLGHVLAGVRDSKLLTPKQREHWAAQIRQCATALATGAASPEEVDQLGIIKATRLAMQRALLCLPHHPAHLLLDYLLLPDLPIPQTSLPHGEHHALSIAAASIIAKVSRDHLLQALELRFPGYGFAAHKGYGTPQHKAALAQLGPCLMHRFSFAPVAACCPSANTHPAGVADKP
jgi:ribonuclease HII